MAWTQDDLDNLKAAVVSGARRLTKSNGETVEFRDLEELRTLIGLVTAEVAATAGTPIRRVRAIRVIPTRGL